MAQNPTNKASSPDGAPVFEDPRLRKGFATPNMPAGIPHRRIDAMANAGAYRGIRDPRAATNVTYDILHLMSRHSMVRAVLLHVIKIVRRYARTPRRRGDYGFRIELRDPEARMTAEQRDEALLLTEFIERGGWDYIRTVDGQVARWDGFGEERALPFPQFMGILTEDSLIFDGAAVRKEFPRDVDQHPVYQQFPKAREYGSPFPPVWFAPVSGRRIRRAEQTYRNRDEVEEAAGGAVVPRDTDGGYQAEIRPELENHVAYVQLSERNEIAREFAWNELGYFVRNLDPDTWTDGYGRSELEYAVEIVTGLSSGVTFNVEYFTHDHRPEGILNLSGEWSEEYVKQFQEDLVTEVGGPGNYHRLPVLWSPDPDAKALFLATRGDTRLDMYWEKWISWVVCALCALIGVPPEAINFASFKGGAGSALNEADPSTRLLYGDDVTVVPFMLAIESFINEQLIWPIDNRYCFRWANLRERDEEKQFGLVERKLMAGYYTVNEARTELGEPEIQWPLDRHLWRMIEQKVQRKWEALRDDTAERERITAQIYEHLDGEYALWPDAPGNVTALIAQQEIGGLLGGGEMGMEEMMGLGPGAFGAPGSGDEGMDPTGGGVFPGPDGYAEEGEGEDDPDAILQHFLPPTEDMAKSVAADLAQARSRLSSWQRALGGNVDADIEAAIDAVLGADER